MMQAYLEKSKLEKEEAERTRQRALKTQEDLKFLNGNEMKIGRYMIK